MSSFNKNYSNKLQDPRWQKKRLHILERDNFTCKCCGARDKRLDVHHHLYEKGKDPWDYTDDIYETLCLRCHAIVEFLKKKVPSVTVVKAFYKENQNEDFTTVYVITLEKKKILLTVFSYYHEKNIEMLVHIPSRVINIVSSLFEIQKNG